MGYLRTLIFMCLTTQNNQRKIKDTQEQSKGG